LENEPNPQKQDQSFQSEKTLLVRVRALQQDIDSIQGQPSAKQKLENSSSSQKNCLVQQNSNFRYYRLQIDRSLMSTVDPDEND
jgi:hypothetical protein